MVETERSFFKGKRLALENFFVFNTVWQVGFIEVKASFPFLAFTEAKVFHKFGRGIAKMDRDWFVHGSFGEVLSGKPSVGSGTRFFR